MNLLDGKNHTRRIVQHNAVRGVGTQSCPVAEAASQVQETLLAGLKDQRYCLYLSNTGDHLLPIFPDKIPSINSFEDGKTFRDF